MPLYALLIVLNTAVLPPSVEAIDSRDDSRYTYILIKTVDKDCKVLVHKSELKDYDTIMKIVMEKCGL